MPEIFRFTQLREPTGINIEEVRLKHIQFFKGIEGVENMEINTAFLDSFEKGMEAVENYLKTNDGFWIRSNITKEVINEWTSPLPDVHKIYFELAYLLSQYNSDKKADKNENLFAQISNQLKRLSEQETESRFGLEVYFEDLLVLYFNSSEAPSYLRILINLRRWYFVFRLFSLTEIIQSFKKLPEENASLAEDSVLYFLLKAKILLPKYLFTKKTQLVTEPIIDGAVPGSKLSGEIISNPKVTNIKRS